jgi:hypothetical protein
MASTGVRRTRYRRPACPFCRYEDQVVRIVYGYPGPDLIEQSRRGEVALGGCCIGPDAHEWYCRGCLRSFNAPDFSEGASPES